MPPRSVKNGIDEEQALASVVGQMITVTEERRDQMEGALWDLALGHCVLLPYGAKPPQGVEVVPLDIPGPNGETEGIRVYLRPPDGAMLKMLIEQHVGRPGSRLAKEHEQVICVMHAIPGWSEEDEDVKYVGEQMTAPALMDDEELNPWPSAR